MNSEINLNEPFGYEIFQTVIKYDLRRNLEIGSWDGEGSTTCFVEAMKHLSGERELQCIEVIKDKLEVLIQRFKDVDFVKCFHGSSISYEQMVYKDFEHVWNSSYNKIRQNLYAKELVQSWYTRDIEIIKASPSFINSDIGKYDGVLIDGGEFTGYSEFIHLPEKPRVIFLDDVHHAFKCYEIYCLLKGDSKWRILTENSTVRNGFAIFLNLNYDN